MTLIAPTTKCNCPTCGGKGVITMVIWKGRPNAVEVRKPCLDCANSGKVEYKDWKKITGRD